MVDLIKQEGEFKYVEKGKGDVLILLHGLFGALSNFKDVLQYFSKKYQVIIPLLPIYDSTLLDDVSVSGLVKYVDKFLKFKDYKNITLLGNSLGGHVALIYALEHPKRVKSMVLTGSSGLYENSLGGTYPKRGNYEYIKEKAGYTFYDPKTATKELVDEVFAAVNDRKKVIRIIGMSKSAIKHNLANDLHKLRMPVSLIWGKNDTITPTHVAEEFEKLIPNAKLEFIDKCGHAPMMERPKEFNIILDKFLENLSRENID